MKIVSILSSGSFGDGRTSKAFRPEVTYATTGTFTVKLDVYYGLERVAITPRSVTINPYTKFSLGADQSVCSGTRIAIGEILPSYRCSMGDTTRWTYARSSGDLVLIGEKLLRMHLP